MGSPHSCFFQMQGLLVLCHMSFVYTLFFEQDSHAMYDMWCSFMMFPAVTMGKDSFDIPPQMFSALIHQPSWNTNWNWPSKIGITFNLPLHKSSTYYNLLLHKIRTSILLIYNNPKSHQHVSGMFSLQTETHNIQQPNTPYCMYNAIPAHGYLWILSAKQCFLSLRMNSETSACNTTDVTANGLTN